MNIWILVELFIVLRAPLTDKTFEYEIKKGDTCASIAESIYGDRKYYKTIHRYNRRLAPGKSHHLEQGQTIVLPLAPPSAEVTATHSQVDARPPEASNWRAAQPGLDLYRGWRVNTHEQASAEIAFQDSSRIEMRQNTLVIIYGGSSASQQRSTATAALDRGALRNRLGSYTGKGTPRRVTVSTPSAVAEFEGGTSLVTVDPQGVSRVANHGKGRAAVRSSGTSSGAKIAIKPNMGSKVAAGKPPSRPKPLPPTPTWLNQGPTIFAGIGDRGGTISGDWSEVAKAKTYRVEVSREPDGTQPFTNQIVPAKVHRFEMKPLPGGDYFVSVAAIDDDAFESPPSPPRKVSVVPIDFITPGAAPVPAALGQDGPPTNPQLLRGTRLDIPHNLRCRIGQGPLMRAPALDQEGTHSVLCVFDDGRSIPGFLVTVVDMKLAAQAKSPRIPREQVTYASFSIETPIPPPRRLWVKAPSGLIVGEPAPTARRGHWTIPLYAQLRAPSAASLRIMADVGGDPVELGQLEIQLDNPRPPLFAPPPPPERHMIELGVYGGMMLPASNHDLYQERFSDRLQYLPLARVASSIGLRVGYYPIRWIGAELENGFGPTHTRQKRQPATIIAIRGQVIAQLPTRITPTLHVGAGALGIAGNPFLGRDFDRSLHFGGGLKVYAIRNIALRLDARDVISKGYSESGDGGFAHSLELTGGLSVVFGRRSAGRPTTKSLRSAPAATSRSSEGADPAK